MAISNNRPRNPRGMVKFSGGKGSSSAQPRFELVPTEALVRLVERFELGIERRPDGSAWNALSGNQEVLVDRDFILNRIGHLIGHALRLRDKVSTGKPLGDDDAGAIIWAGAFLCCATKALAEGLDSKAAAK